MQLRESPAREQVVANKLLPWGSGFCQTQELEPRFTAAPAPGATGKVHIANPTTTRAKYLQIGSFLIRGPIKCKHRSSARYGSNRGQLNRIKKVLSSDACKAPRSQSIPIVGDVKADRLNHHRLEKVFPVDARPALSTGFSASSRISRCRLFTWMPRSRAASP